MIRTHTYRWNPIISGDRNHLQWVWLVLIVLNCVTKGATGSAAQPELREPGPGDHLATRLSQRLASELWKSRISVPQETPQQLREKSRLAQLIQRVQATRVGPGAPKPAASAPETHAASVQQPVDTHLPVKHTERGALASPNEPKPPVTEAVSESSLKDMLQQISETPDTLKNPFELAELLRRSGDLVAAAKYYQVALARQQEDTPHVARRRAWMLFQAACCLRYSDAKGAKRLYQQLLDEYPQSPWSVPAQTLLDLVAWYDAEQPMELIRQCMGVDTDN